MNRRALALIGATLSLVACRPELGVRDSLVTQERFLAVRGEPPESASGAPVVYDALVADVSGTVVAAPLAWAFCHESKVLADNDVVSAACTGSSVVPLPGPAPTVTAPTPSDACALFGPDPPPGGYRPADPDTTGGYYQPLRVTTPDGQLAFGLERVRCNATNVPVDVAAAYSKAYANNKNPTLLPLVASVAGVPIALDRVAAGARVDLQVGWPAGAAETFPVIDLASQSLVGQRESMRLSWFATGGVFDADRTGREASDPATTTDNGWTAPAQPSIVHLWIVLRDSRGGVDFASYDVTVGPRQ